MAVKQGSTAAGKVTFNKVEIARREYLRLIREYEKTNGHYLQRAPTLKTENVQNCSVLQDRYAIIEKLPKNGIVAEIGVDKGLFSKFILDTAKPELLVLFEADVSRIDPANIYQQIKKDTCKIIEGDSSSNLAKYDDNYFDWIYIDGDHRYEGVKKDIDVAKSKVKPCGFLVFNDYTVWSPSTMYHCGVAKAVNELCLNERWELIYFCFQSNFYNDVAIQKLGA
jgi:hypothetical protein